MDRLRERGRQLLAWRDWPLASGILLAICAVGEALLRGFATPALIMSVVATGPLALRDRYLPTVAVMVSGATAALLALQHGVSVAGLIGQLMVLSLLAARYPRPASAVGLVPLAGNVIYPYTGSAGSRPVALLLFCLGAAAVALGYGRRKLTQVRHDNAVLAERARIARELHDVVAHHVSMMVVQAESARVGTPGMPPAGPASRAPQPGLRDLDELIAAARAAGNDVQLRREGQPHPVPAGVDVTAYRIVQEALTNVRRHAPGAPAEVLLRYADHTVQVKIRDRGPGPATINRDGHGLLGMRERAAMIGGSLHTGPAPGGGYVVIADLPVREAASRRSGWSS